MKTISEQDSTELLQILEKRFAENLTRHEGLSWEAVQTKLKGNTQKLWSLNEMERTGGEPDVVGFDKASNEFVFMDCSAESPAGRRSTCYDMEGLLSRKQHRPENNAVDMAVDMGIEMLTEQEYRQLQELGEFDAKTSSWLKTPPEIRELGGAIFGDFRFGKVFVYHNGAQSYYAARGFRGVLKV